MEKNNGLGIGRQCYPGWSFLIVYKPWVGLNGNKDSCGCA